MSIKKKMVFTACSLLVAGQAAHADDPREMAMGHQDLGSGAAVRGKVMQSSKAISDSSDNNGSDQQKGSTEGSCGQGTCGSNKPKNAKPSNSDDDDDSSSEDDGS